VLCAGDLLFEYRFSNEVLALLDRRGVRSITGNHDRTILRTRNHPLQAAPTTEPYWLRYLAALPAQLDLTLGGARVLVAHGAPWDPPDQIQATYVLPHDRSQFQRLATTDADVVILGHTHQPMAQWAGRVLVINPGSCGDPRAPVQTHQCARLDLDSRSVEQIAFSL
jgi:putative phosphoesterase